MERPPLTPELAEFHRTLLSLDRRKPKSASQVPKLFKELVSRDGHEEYFVVTRVPRSEIQKVVSLGLLAPFRGDHYVLEGIQGYAAEEDVAVVSFLSADALSLWTETGAEGRERPLSRKKSKQVCQSMRRLL